MGSYVSFEFTSGCYLRYPFFEIETKQKIIIKHKMFFFVVVVVVWSLSLTYLLYPCTYSIFNYNNNDDNYPHNGN